jgi:hypothetical protein
MFCGWLRSANSLSAWFEVEIINYVVAYHDHESVY